MKDNTVVINKKIMVLYGGISAEREISIISAEEIIGSLKRNGYEVSEIDADPDLAEPFRSRRYSEVMEQDPPEF